MRIREDVGLTFDDVLLVPQYTNIKSRKDVSLRTQFTKNIKINSPIVSSNMDTITEYKMMLAMEEAGGMGILHRFISDEEIIFNISTAIGLGLKTVCFSVGISDNFKELLERVKDLDPREEVKKVVTIDVAHGACKRVVDAILFIKENYSWEVIAGNVATTETAAILCEAGADAIKVGIGNGSVCITRKVAGAGVPLLTSISDCYKVTKRFKVPIICDGGIRNSGDIVKALAAGASSVITGSLLAGTDETPGKTVIKDDGSRYKKYRGMASKSAMDSWRGDSYKDVAAEGESTLVPVKGSAKDVVSSLCAGVRSGMTYCNAVDLEQLRNNALFIRNTAIGFNENGAHLLGRL